ncbi:MAG TPA: hypothetical protein VF624_02520 [Tepidisphaeraceae bacterium]|jgi:hypothetical protein
MTNSQAAVEGWPSTPAPAEPGTFEFVLSKLTVKDRLKAEKTLAAVVELDAPRAALWRRLAAMLMGLAGHAVKISGPQSLQFFVADGNYRMQVFGLDDAPGTGAIVYCKDVLDEAVAAKLLAAPQAETNRVGVPKSKESLAIDRLVGDNTTEHPASFKDMLSWNRRAIRIAVPPDASESLLQTVEAVCRLSAAAAQAKPAAKKA